MQTFDILFPNCNFINNKPDPFGKGMDVNDTNSNKNITHWGLSTLLACGSLRRSPDSDAWLEAQNHLLSWRVPQPRWRGGFTAVFLFLLKSMEKCPTSRKNLALIWVWQTLSSICSCFNGLFFTVTISFDAVSFLSSHCELSIFLTL